MNKTFDTSFLTAQAGAEALDVLTPAQFAALGAGSVVFHRRIKAADLAEFVPQAAMAPAEQLLELLMSADGAPILIADTPQAVADWIEGHEVRLATLH